MPEEICMPQGSGLSDLIDWVYPQFHVNCHDPVWIARRMVLCSKNKDVDNVNATVYEKWPEGAGSESFESLSADALEGDDAEAQSMTISTEYLNSLRISGMPPHKLTLRRGMPIMLLRNLRSDLCNGTRLIFERTMGNRILIAKLPGSDEEIAIPRIKLSPLNDGTFPFEWSRRQFPVVLAFSVSVNKSQGQTMECVGINALDPCFTHGQCYVAASRVGDKSKVRFLIDWVPGAGRGFVTRNTVYSEVLAADEPG